MRRFVTTLVMLGGGLGLWLPSGAEERDGSVSPLRRYPIVDTGQQTCHDDRRSVVYPAPGAAYFGQDAQYRGHAPSYVDHGDGQISDRVTGLVWQKTPSTTTRTWGEAASFDRDGDGRVSRREFDGPPEHFGHFDRNADGFIDASEAPSGPPPERRR